MIPEVYTTRSGKEFRLEVNRSPGASLWKVKVSSNKFEIVNEVYDLGEVDPVETVFIADLDKNGFEELYIVTRSAGSGSYARIYGIASNRDKSTSPVYVPETDELAEEFQSFFESYRGHDTFWMKEGILYRSFPVYDANDTNSQSAKGERILRYLLLAGEAGWILHPKKIIK